MKYPLSCYHCLSTDIKADEITQRTGGINHYALCPRCGIDSIVYSYPDFRLLFAKHLNSFHSATNGSGKKLYHSCGYDRCKEVCDKIMEVWNTPKT